MKPIDEIARLLEILRRLGLDPIVPGAGPLLSGRVPNP
jgi:hypothetical protein